MKCSRNTRKMFALTQAQTEKVFIDERKAIERTLHILGQRRIDAKTTRLIIACIRTIRKIDAEKGVTEK